MNPNINPNLKGEFYHFVLLFVWKLQGKENEWAEEMVCRTKKSLPTSVFFFGEIETCTVSKRFKISTIRAGRLLTRISGSTVIVTCRRFPAKRQNAFQTPSISQYLKISRKQFFACKNCSLSSVQQNFPNWSCISPIGLDRGGVWPGKRLIFWLNAFQTPSVAHDRSQMQLKVRTL